jgi:hypothetical protein
VLDRPLDQARRSIRWAMARPSSPNSSRTMKATSPGSRGRRVADSVVLVVVHVAQAADRPGGQWSITKGVKVDASEVDGCGPVAVTVDIYSHAHGSDPGAAWMRVRRLLPRR